MRLRLGDWVFWMIGWNGTRQSQDSAMNRISTCLRILIERRRERKEENVKKDKKNGPLKVRRETLIGLLPSFTAYFVLVVNRRRPGCT